MRSYIKIKRSISDVEAEDAEILRTKGGCKISQDICHEHKSRDWKSGMSVSLFDDTKLRRETWE
jgi:hypothetical protein